MEIKERIQNLSKSVGNYLYRFVLLQLFITLISWPILIAWGLPLSLLSPLGNLIFSPFLYGALFLSSLLFLTELVGIPNSIIAWALETISQWWFKLLALHDSRFVLATAQPYWWILAAIAILTVLITTLRFTKKPNRSILAFTLLCLCVGASSKLFPVHKDPVSTIPCKKGAVTVIHDKQSTIIVDPGYISSVGSAESWVAYTLVPEIVKRTGRLHINHLITLQPSSRLWQALTELLDKIEIDHLYIPYWQGSLEKSQLRAFCKLKEQCAQHNTKLRRMGDYPITIPLDYNNHCTIVPLEHMLKYAESTYRSLGITGMVDTQSFTFYAAQEKNQSIKGTIHGT